MGTDRCITHGHKNIGYTRGCNEHAELLEAELAQFFSSIPQVLACNGADYCLNRNSIPSVHLHFRASARARTSIINREVCVCQSEAGYKNGCGETLETHISGSFFTVRYVVLNAQESGAIVAERRKPQIFS